MGIFSNFKNKVKEKAMEKMMEKQIANLPPEQREAIIKMMTDNPEFFENIAKEIEEEIRNGKSQIAASMAVMRKHQAKMQELMMKSMGGNPLMKDKNLK